MKAGNPQNHIFWITLGKISGLNFFQMDDYYVTVTFQLTNEDEIL